MQSPLTENRGDRTAKKRIFAVSNTVKLGIYNEANDLSLCVNCFMCKLCFVFRANLVIVKELGDRAAQGRACGNLGNTHYLLGNFDLAIMFHEEVRVLTHNWNGNIRISPHPLSLNPPSPKTQKSSSSRKELRETYVLFRSITSPISILIYSCRPQFSFFFFSYTRM